MDSVPVTWWIGFHLLIVFMLWLDLGVFHRKAHVISIREALLWTAVWVMVAMGLNAFVYFEMGKKQALEFLAGYVTEKSLSVDNIFVFVLIFTYFNVAPQHQHRVLTWGIIGAVLMRAALILVGVTLVHLFHWMIYLFAIFLIVSGIKFALAGDEPVHPEHNPVLQIARRWFRVTPGYVEGKFFAHIKGKLFATPLFLVLLVIESTDLLFALDSIPAIIGLTKDPFIIYTSNIMAILGLRALYFAVAGLMDLFHYLKFGLATVLVFIGLKMLLEDVYELPITVALGVIVVVLTVAIVASLLHRPAPKEKPGEAPA
ncbi:MAG TPA: TerC family protein, partial [Candidatus Nitrosotenuis sp.]|nr:TerC family protein [Candidatus Nitrosotenuis sp.]